MGCDPALEARIRVGRQAVKDQIDFFHAHFGQVESQWKEDRTRVTMTDLTISNEVEKVIGEAFAEDQFFSEETACKDGPVPVNSEYFWIIDPVDGTNNYALGMSMCAISLGLFRDGMPVYGWIYDYSRRSLMEGGPGMGITDGGKPMKASDRQLGGQLYVAFNSSGKEPELVERMLQFCKHGCRLRDLGSGALHMSYLANGIMDGAISTRLRIWDIAAALAFVEEAGLRVKWLGKSPLPYRQFDVEEAPSPFYAGSETFLKVAEEVSPLS